jgi:hypothetical protein
VIAGRRVWRYQRGDQNPYIEEEQTTQWPKEKVQRDKQRFTKHTHTTKDQATTRLTRREQLLEQELLTLSEHPSSPPDFSGVRVAWSLVVCVCFVNRCLSLCTSQKLLPLLWHSSLICAFCLYVVELDVFVVNMYELFTSSIYGFGLPLWYLQTLLTSICDWVIACLIDWLICYSLIVA